MNTESKTSWQEDLEAIASVFFPVFFICLIVFFFLWRNLEVTRLRYQVSKLKKKKRELYLDVERLRLQVAKYSTAERIEKLFREKYGYLPVSVSQNIVTVKLPSVQPLESGSHDED